jgi:hypothetical protein
VVVGQFVRHIRAAAKAAIDFEALTARLKPGPFKTYLDRPTTCWVDGLGLGWTGALSGCKLLCLA